MSKILGLTGGIASGKSTVSNYFKAHHIPVVDADKIANDIMAAGQPVVEDIRKYFGPEYILENGEVDRALLGKIVFASPEKLSLLNDLVQDEIRKEIKKQAEALLKENYPLIVLDVPLLYEGRYEPHLDEIMVIYVDKETQKERLLKRNPELTEEDALNRIQSQMPLEQKAKRADILIDNNGTINETIKQVEEWLHKTFPNDSFKA